MLETGKMTGETRTYNVITFKCFRVRMVRRPKTWLLFVTFSENFIVVSQQFSFRSQSSTCRTANAVTVNNLQETPYLTGRHQTWHNKRQHDPWFYQIDEFEVFSLVAAHPAIGLRPIPLFATKHAGRAMRPQKLSLSPKAATVKFISANVYAYFV